MKRSMVALSALAAGALFTVGLAVGGMTVPAKVQGFLDVTGRWDPSLLFVMAGAIAVYAVAHRLLVRRGKPLFDTKFHLPSRRDLDVRLLAGAAVFGVGWGLAGCCPGPGLASLATGLTAVVFVATMAAGMLLHRKLDEGLQAARARSATERSSS